MKYSIVMPVFLREDSHRPIVEDCIASIKANSEDYELIIVDDGSILPTGFLKEQADVYIRHNGGNKGISISWNDGISVARGDYIVICNDDIVVSEGWLNVLSKAFENQNCGVSGPIQAGPNVEPKIIENGEYIINHSFFPGYCFCLKRDRFLEKFDERFVPANCEDCDMWYRIELVKLDLFKVPLAIWHQEGGVLHNFGVMSYKELYITAINKFIGKWGFSPIKKYYSYE